MIQDKMEGNADCKRHCTFKHRASIALKEGGKRVKNRTSRNIRRNKHLALHGNQHRKMFAEEKWNYFL